MNEAVTKECITLPDGFFHKNMVDSVLCGLQKLNDMTNKESSPLPGFNDRLDGLSWFEFEVWLLASNWTSRRQRETFIFCREGAMPVLGYYFWNMELLQRGLT